MFETRALALAALARLADLRDNRISDVHVAALFALARLGIRRAL